MLLELGQFVSLLLGILTLYAAFHSAFLAPASELLERIVQSLRLLLLAAFFCLASGWIFRRCERQAGDPRARIATTLPMKMFYWAAGALLVFFVVSWFLETYYLPYCSRAAR